MDPEKFAKVIALAESDHHGEAQSALRAARIMLARAGLSFRDLAVAARQPEPRPPPPPEDPAPTVQMPTWGPEAEALRRQIRDLEQRVLEMEQALAKERGELARQRQETKRWHQLARETAEQLWDVGKALENREKQNRGPGDKRRTLIELLRDPARADWSDREIARRVGVAPHAVGYWRRRLALAERTRHQLRALPRGRRLFARLSARTLPDGIR